MPDGPFYGTLAMKQLLMLLTIENVPISLIFDDLVLVFALIEVVEFDCGPLSSRVVSRQCLLRVGSLSGSLCLLW